MNQYEKARSFWKTKDRTEEPEAPLPVPTTASWGGYAALEEHYEEDPESEKQLVAKEKKKEEREKEKETTSYVANTEEGSQYTDSIDVSCYGRSYIFEDEDAEQSGGKGVYAEFGRGETGGGDKTSLRLTEGYKGRAESDDDESEGWSSSDEDNSDERSLKAGYDEDVDSQLLKIPGSLSLFTSTYHWSLRFGPLTDELQEQNLSHERR